MGGCATAGQAGRARTTRTRRRAAQRARRAKPPRARRSARQAAGEQAKKPRRREQAKKIAASAKAEFDARRQEVGRRRRSEGRRRRGRLQVAGGELLRRISRAGAGGAGALQRRHDPRELRLRQGRRGASTTRRCQANPALRRRRSTNLGELYYSRGNPTTRASRGSRRRSQADPTHAGAGLQQPRARSSTTQGKQTGDRALYNEAISQRCAARSPSTTTRCRPTRSSRSSTTPSPRTTSRSSTLARARLQAGASETDDKYAPIYNTLGPHQAAQEERRPARSRSSSRRCELDPKYVEAHLNIGAIGLSSRQYEKAAAVVRGGAQARSRRTSTRPSGMGVAHARPARRSTRPRAGTRRRPSSTRRTAPSSTTSASSIRTTRPIADNSNLQAGAGVLRQVPRAAATPTRRRSRTPSAA